MREDKGAWRTTAERRRWLLHRNRLWCHLSSLILSLKQHLQLQEPHRRETTPPIVSFSQVSNSTLHSRLPLALKVRESQLCLSISRKAVMLWNSCFWREVSLQDKSSTSGKMRPRSGKVGCVPQSSGEATNWRFLETPTNKLTHTTGGETRPKSVLQNRRSLKQDLHIASVFSSNKMSGPNLEMY